MIPAGYFLGLPLSPDKVQPQHRMRRNPFCKHGNRDPFVFPAPSLQGRPEVPSSAAPHVGPSAATRSSLWAALTGPGHDMGTQRHGTWAHTGMGHGHTKAWDMDVPSGCVEHGKEQHGDASRPGRSQAHVFLREGYPNQNSTCTFLSLIFFFINILKSFTFDQDTLIKTRLFLCKHSSATDFDRRARFWPTDSNMHLG